MKKREHNKMPIILLALLLVVAVALIITGVVMNGNSNSNNNGTEQKKEEFVQVLDNGTKVNVSSKLNETKKLGDLSIGNIKYTYSNGISNISAEVTNNSDKATDLKDIKLTLLDKNNEVMAELEGLIAPIEPGAKTKLTLSVTLDLVNAYDFSIEEM